MFLMLYNVMVYLFNGRFHCDLLSNDQCMFNELYFFPCVIMVEIFCSQDGVKSVTISPGVPYRYMVGSLGNHPALYDCQ